MHPSEREDTAQLLEERISAAIISEDNELDRLLREASHITESLKSKVPDARTLGNVLRRAVQCAVKQSILDRELRSLALTDELTGLHNRRGFLALAKQQLKVADRNREGMLLFFGDIDDLKKINDRYGHHEGDLAVVRAAEALKQTFRDSDIVARLGGDEFAILALETSAQYQQAILHRLNENLNKLNSGERRYEVALSVGVARFDPGTSTRAVRSDLTSGPRNVRAQARPYGETQRFRLVDHQPGRRDCEADPPQRHPHFPEGPLARQQRDGANHEPRFQQNLRQIEAVCPPVLDRDFLLRFAGFLFDIRLLLLVARELLGILLLDAIDLRRILEREHGGLVDKKFVAPPPDVLRLVVGPLVGCFRLEKQLFGIGAMSEQ